MTSSCDHCDHCDHCGRAAEAGDHVGCLAARAMEPPRHRARRRRRMAVQVTPDGWSARCAEHGLLGG
ncbi:hypothetical protein [Streptosporangium canum]|uniref:biotin synthase auxiliary protein BsaP n=1 Tax=Streptosporangium canum TaxID=324952 RepID=UPI00341FD8D6